MPELTSQPTVERFRRWGIIAWASIGVLVLGSAAVWALSRVPEIIPPLVVGVISIYMLNPVVTRLERLGVRRLVGSCSTYLLLIAGLATAIAFLIPALIEQGTEFGRDFPSTVEHVGESIEDLTEWVEGRVGADINFSEWVGNRSELIERGLGGAGGLLQGAAETIALVVVGLVLGFYLLVDLPRLRRAMIRLLPPDRRGEASTIAGDVAQAMGGFFRGQLFVALIVGVMSALGLWIIGLPYWLVVGFIAGFFNLVPLIGPFVGAVPAILIAAALKPPSTILWVVVVMVVVQQIDNHFISPNVMRMTVRMHPVTIMITLIAGATLGGFWGMLLAVPTVASVKVVAAHFWRTRVPWGEEVFYEGDEMETLPDEQAAPAETDKAAEPPAPAQPQ